MRLKKLRIKNKLKKKRLIASLYYFQRWNFICLLWITLRDFTREFLILSFCLIRCFSCYFTITFNFSARKLNYSSYPFKFEFRFINYCSGGFIQKWYKSWTIPFQNNNSELHQRNYTWKKICLLFWGKEKEYILIRQIFDYGHYIKDTLFKVSVETANGDSRCHIMFFY